MASYCCAAVPIGFRRNAISGRQPLKDSQGVSGILGMFLVEPFALWRLLTGCRHMVCGSKKRRRYFYPLLSSLRDTVA